MLCFKTGNATILRGGSEAFHSNRAIAEALQAGGEKAGLPAHAIQLMRSTDALSDTIEHARRYGRRAMDALAGFPANKAKAALVEAVEFAIARAY